LAPGAHHYRAFVGPPAEFDLVGGSQVSLLLALGLREWHRLVDVGCGSLRAGRLLIPYLEPGRYHGLEPEHWLVRKGIRRELGRSVLRVKKPRFLFRADFDLRPFGMKFDVVLAQSVFSHTRADLASLAMRRISEGLATRGLLVATFVDIDSDQSPEDQSGLKGTGWEYPAVVRYRWDDIHQLLERAGLAGCRIDWQHPRQSWFVAGHREQGDEIAAAAAAVRPPLVGAFGSSPLLAVRR
jgi:SAM-dependent methyltransferase